MTASFIPFVLVVATLVTLVWMGHARWKKRTQRALWGAFSTTSASVFFLTSGCVGYGLQKGPAIFADSRWTGAVIWPQVWLGLALIPVAVWCWFRAVRETDRRLGLE